MSSAIAQLKGVKRSFEQGGQRIDVLRGVDLTIEPGEIVALLGPSGSGKSTLLQAVGLLEGGFEGSIAIAGTAAETLPSDQRTALRREHLGFVYQFHHLLPDFDARENVIMPQMIAGTPRDDAEKRADALLTSLGLSARLSHRPSQLSGGEQQRVAVARALANQPTLVLADEPTGNLDEATSDTVLAQFLKLVRGEGSAALVATHNERLAARMGAMKVGPGTEEGVAVGPLIDGPTFDKVREHVDAARSLGATAVLGGEPHALGRTFHAPTVLTGVTSEMKMCREETFGPVAGVQRFTDEGAALALANAPRAGLVAYFYSRDVGRAFRVAEALEAGMVGVNTGLVSSPVAPFGGVKESGLGREGSRHGLDDWTELKYVALSL